MTGIKRRWGAECKRSGQSCLTVAFFLWLLVTTAAAESHKVRVNDPKSARELMSRGGKLVADYGGFQLIETADSLEELRQAGVQAVDEPDVIELNSQRINTSLSQWRVAKKGVGRFNGKRFHLVQFAGPIKPEWRVTLEQTGVRIVNYIF